MLRFNDYWFEFFSLFSLSFPAFGLTCCFSVQSTIFSFTRGCHQILLLPHIAPVMCFSRRWHHHFLFPRSVPASHFPAFGTSCLFPALCSGSPSCRCLQAEFIGWSSGLQSFSWQQPSWTADIRSFYYLFQLDALHPAESTLTSCLAAGKQPLEALQEAVEVDICYYLWAERFFCVKLLCWAFMRQLNQLV